MALFVKRNYQHFSSAIPSMRREWLAIEEIGRSFELKNVEMFFETSRNVGAKIDGTSCGTAL